jgi:large repetitive protein
MTSIFRVRGRETGDGRTGRKSRQRGKFRIHFDNLEPRTLLTATLSVDGAGTSSFLSQTLGSTVELSYAPITHTYTFDDTEGVAAGTIDPAFTYTQVTGTEATLAPVDFTIQDFTSLSFDQNVENIDYLVTSLGTPTSFVDTSLTPPAGTPLSDSFYFGNTAHAQSLITADVSIALTTESAAITVDDSQDTTAQVINISSSQVDFNTTPSFNYASTVSVASLLVLGGSGGNTVNVTGTPAGTSASPTTTTYTASGATTGDTVYVQGTSQYGPLTLNNLNPTSSVDVGNNAGDTLGDLAGILGAVDITGATLLPLTVDDFNDTGDHNATLDVNSGTGQGELIDLAPAAISYDLGSLSGTTLNTGTGTNLLTVDFANGNPLPGIPGLTYNALGTTSALYLVNGTFSSDAYVPNIPGTAGASITLTDASSNTYPIAFTGLASISDVLTVTNYAFTAPIPTAGDPASLQGYYVDLVNGPTVDAIATAEISSPATPAIFTTLNYANKTNVTIDLTPIWQSANPADAGFVYDNANTAGQSTLNVLLGQGNDTVNVEATAPGVTTTINTGGGDDTVTVVGTGLAAGTSSSNFTINGGTGANTLVINATGTTVDTSVPGIVTFGDPTSFAYLNFSTILVTGSNTAPVITAGSTITAAQNVPLVNDVVATFTDADTIENATNYTATIGWGDGSSSAGSIAYTGTSTVGGVTVNDYTITGTHTYTAGGTYATDVIVTDLGGTFTTIVGGVPVTTTVPSLPPSAPTPAATVNVNALAAGTFSTGQVTAGTLTSFPALFTFTDNPSPLAASAYSATINWGDGSPSSGGTLTSAAGVFTVAGFHNYAQIGTYTITVTINGDGQQLTASTTAGQEPVVGLTVNPLLGLTATAGTLSTPLSVASFTATPSPGSDSYHAVVDWGDGSTPVVAAITTTATPGTYDIATGGHNFAAIGSYTLTVTITDAQGFVVGTASPSVTVAGLTLSPFVTLAYAGIPTGPLAVTTLTGTTDTTGYTALVDWGDGTTPVVASIVSAAAPATNFDVDTSGHTYAQGGITYALTITIRDAQGYVVGTAINAITVEVISLSGKLSPQSDTGISNTDGITNDTTPTFVGNTSPGTTVEVFATPSGSAVTPGSQIAIGAANSAGYWSATVVNTPLTDGSYTITAEAVNTSDHVLATASLGTVVIDTVAPVITTLTFDRFDDTVTVTYQDNLSGMDYASIANSAFYHLSAKPLAADVPVPKMLLPTSISIIPGATPTSPEVVSVVFNHGRPVRGGRYLIVIDSGTGNTGVQDIAGNALDGNFYGSFPSGDGLPGGDFVASIDTFHNNIVLAPVPVKDGYVPPSAAVDPPAHGKTVKKPVKVVHSALKVVSQPVRQAQQNYDAAIESIFGPTKAKHRLV